MSTLITSNQALTSAKASQNLCATPSVTGTAVSHMLASVKHLLSVLVLCFGKQTRSSRADTCARWHTDSTKWDHLQVATRLSSRNQPTGQRHYQLRVLLTKLTNRMDTDHQVGLGRKNERTNPCQSLTPVDYYCQLAIALRGTNAFREPNPLPSFGELRDTRLDGLWL